MNGQYLKQETSLSDICKFIYFEVELKPCHHVVSYALRHATAPHCVLLSHQCLVGLTLGEIETESP